VTKSPDRYRETQAAMRIFLDRLAGSRPDDAMMATLVNELTTWSERLKVVAASERDQYAGNRDDLPAHGRFMVPSWQIVSVDDQSICTTVRFGRYFMGIGNAAHGGAVALVFDEVLGRFASHNRTLEKRTAYLHVDYRSVTPLDTDLTLTARISTSEGRKHFVNGRIENGDIVCAEAEALFVELKPGQSLQYLTL
jgi:acyl-coenzyme A thioesterase PaaI-like protein